MAANLAEQTAFPDLEGCEDADVKIEQATASVKALRTDVLKEQQAVDGAKADAEARRRAARAVARPRAADLSMLADRLNKLAASLGTHEAGYAFQGWFYDLAEYFAGTHHEGETPCLSNRTRDTSEQLTSSTDAQS